MLVSSQYRTKNGKSVITTYKISSNKMNNFCGHDFHNDEFG